MRFNTYTTWRLGINATTECTNRSDHSFSLSLSLSLLFSAKNEGDREREAKGKGRRREGGKPHSSTSSTSSPSLQASKLSQKKLEDSIPNILKPELTLQLLPIFVKRKRMRNPSTTQRANLVSYRPISFGCESGWQERNETERDKRKWREHTSLEGGEWNLVVGSSESGRPRWIPTWLHLEDEQIGPRSRSIPYRILYNIRLFVFVSYIYYG